MKLGFLFIFLLIMVSFGNAQNVFTVIDSTNSEVVKYAAISQLSNKKVVAFTNENGIFKIYNNDSNYSSGYLIKCLGYKSKAITHLNNSIIYLLPVPTELNTVTIKDINYDKVFKECVEKLHANQEKKLYFNSFYNLYSEHNNGIHEVIECFYSTSSFPNKIESLLIENGRFAFFDSLADNKFISSLDLSNLVTNFNLLNEKQPDYSIFPIVPLFDFNESKYIDRKFIESRFDGNERVVQFLITPIDKYKSKVFNCYVWIGQKTFNIKKLTLTIANPQKTILNTINENSICVIDSVSINILFNEFGTKNSFPEQLNFKLYYNLRNGNEITSLNTIINLVNYETTANLNGFRQTKVLSDREQIKNILYEPNYWKQVNTFIANTPAKEIAINRFNEMKLFGNPFLNKSDTSKFILNEYQYCYDGTLPKLNLKEKPNNALNYLIFKRNEKEVGEIYFDIEYQYCFYNNSFKFRVFPLFDLKKSWCNDEDVRSFIVNNIFPPLNELTIYYSEMLANKTFEFIENKIAPEKIILEKERIITRYYQEQEKLIEKIWCTK